MKSIADQGKNNRKQSDPLEIDEIKFIHLRKTEQPSPLGEILPVCFILDHLPGWVIHHLSFGTTF